MSWKNILRKDWRDELLFQGKEEEPSEEDLAVGRKLDQQYLEQRVRAIPPDKRTKDDWRWIKIFERQERKTKEKAVAEEKAKIEASKPTEKERRLKEKKERKKKGQQFYYKG